jgi:hypothetical protein
MCAGGDIMDKTISEATQILQSISNGKRTQRDWQRRCREEQNDKSKPEVLAEISEKDEPEVNETNRFSSNENPTLYTSVVVSGGLPCAIPCLSNTKIHTEREQKEYIIYLLH